MLKDEMLLLLLLNTSEAEATSALLILYTVGAEATSALLILYTSGAEATSALLILYTSGAEATSLNGARGPPGVFSAYYQFRYSDRGHCV